jgi:FixJ family two-component response regulator
MSPPRKLVAVIDDDSSVRKALDRQMRASGYRCHVFASAEEYLQVASLCDAACLVSDVHLQGLSGLQLAAHPDIRSLGLPVVLISGSSDPQLEGSAQQIAVAFLRKPIAHGSLLETIVDIVGPPIVEQD